MPEQLEQFLANWAYVVWAFGAAGVFYGATKFAISHLHEDKKAHLSLWLQGDYESTWSAQFCAMFDGIFGEKHWHLRCILLSATASVMAVLGLWLLLDHILGLISLRADTGLSLIQALLLGAAINIIPDYLSLYETRWLLQRFERIPKVIDQVIMLTIDAFLTGIIIYVGIQTYLWLTDREPTALVEMMALFSFYAIFFYSTFLTSIWAWAYCLSSWSARFGASWLDPNENLARSIALIVAVFVFIGALAIYPVLKMDNEGRIAIDDLLCENFPASACTHVARLTKDEQQKLGYLSKACFGGVTDQCLEIGLATYKEDPSFAFELWSKSCQLGVARSCASLGYLYSEGIGVDKDVDRAMELYQESCDQNVARGCLNLANLHKNKIVENHSVTVALNLYEVSCNLEEALGCTILAFMYQQSIGVEESNTIAALWYRKGCDGGDRIACENLGVLYLLGIGVKQDYTEANRLLQRGCRGAYREGCTTIGWSRNDSSTGADPSPFGSRP